MIAHFKLLFNHADAWGVTLIISALALVLHDAITPFNVILLLTISVGYWLAFALNDYFDAPFDALDEEKGARNFFVATEEQVGVRRAFVISAVVLSVLAVFLFAQVGWVGLGLLALSLLVMWGYSAPPLRFKSRPGLDLVVHALFVESFPYVLTLLLIGAQWQQIDMAIVVLVCLTSLAAQLEQQIRDADVDAKSGGSFVTRIGVGRATWALRVVTGTLIVVALSFGAMGVFPWFVVGFGVIASPIILHRLLRGQGVGRSEPLAIGTLVVGLIYLGMVLVWRIV